MQFLKDLVLCFVIIGIGFVAPFGVCEKLLEFSVEASLVVAWVTCSSLTAWLMSGDNDYEDDSDYEDGDDEN